MTKFAALSILALAISSAAAAPSPRRWNERPELTQISHSESSLVDASDLTAVVDILDKREPTWRHSDYDRRPDVTQVSSSESSLVDLSDLTAVVDVLDKREPHYRQQQPDVTQVSSSKSTLVDASDLDLLVDILSQNNYFVSKRSDDEILARRGGNDYSPFWARNTKDERCMCVKRTTCGGNGGNGGNGNPPHVYKPTPQPSKDHDHDHGHDWTPKPKPPHVYQPTPVHSCPSGWSSYSKSSLVDLSGADIVLSILSGNQATDEKTIKAQDATCEQGKTCCWKRGPNTCPSGWSSYSKSTLVDLSDANIVLSILSGNKPTNERTIRAKDANCEAGQNCCWKRSSDACPSGWSSYSESSLVDLSGLDVVLSVLSGNKATEQRTVKAKDARCASGKQCCWQRAQKAASCPSGWSSYSKSTLIDLSDITIDLSVLSDNGKVTDTRKVKAKDANCGAGQHCCYQKSESKSSLVDASGLNLGVDLLSNNKDSGKGGLLGGNVIPGLLR